MKSMVKNVEFSYPEKSNNNWKAEILKEIIYCEKCGKNLDKIREETYPKFRLESFICSDPVCTFKICVAKSKTKN